MQTAIKGTILALDVGEVRVGVARAHAEVRIAQPLTTLQRGEKFWSELEELLAAEEAGLLVVGLPRSLDGADTGQTRTIRDFIAELKQHIGIPMETQDEALTSKKAEEELRARGKQFAKGDIDALAATYILEDYLNSEKV